VLPLLGGRSPRLVAWIRPARGSLNTFRIPRTAVTARLHALETRDDGGVASAGIITRGRSIPDFDMESLVWSVETPLLDEHWGAYA
jgi:hypothetical protein